MIKIAILLADGFEEAEALVPADLLLRAGADVKLVSVSGRETVVGSHGFRIGTDIPFEEVNAEDLDLLMLPGGKVGTDNLASDKRVSALLQEVVKKGKYLACICAAPSVPGRLGLLAGKKFTCYPGFEKYATGGIHTGAPVEIDGRFVTAEGMGVADEFGFAIISLLFGKEKSDSIRVSVRKS